MCRQYVLWLKNYFGAKVELPDAIEDVNYFEAGLINSLGIMELVESIESQFNIKFNAMHFQERRFSTINGLAEIIHEVKEESILGE